MTSTILITGATGMMGQDLVPLLHARSDAELVLLLHRRGPEDRPGDFLRSHFGLPASERLRLVRGDVTKADLGLAPEVRRRLTRSVTHVLHAAALTRFDLPLSRCRHVNVGGTRHLAAFAQECPNLRQFGFVSTAYVGGCRTGRLLEDELAHEAGFVNTYEQAKYEAECFLRSIRGDLPVAVYRLSTLFGDSRTGVVRKMIAPHRALRILYSGLAALFPGTPEYRVDLIPSDVTAEVLVRLFLDHFRPGTTYHLTAPPERSFTLSEMVEAAYTAFAEDDTWRQRRYPKPALASPETFDLFARAVEDSEDRVMQLALRSVRHFAHQLSYPKTFDRRNVLQVLPDYDRAMPDVRDYYRKVIRYCLQTQWGRHGSDGRAEAAHLYPVAAD